MPRIEKKSNLAPLREFIKQNETSLYCFCYLMFHSKPEAETVVLETFRELGDFYRKHSTKVSNGELRVKLFSMAWETTTQVDPTDHLQWVNGRDTRKMNEWTKDILTPWSKSHELTESLQTNLFSRVQLLNRDFRAPLILKDFLHFEDEEILQILGSRWGVYRHRLHRGRLDLLNGLKGGNSTVVAGADA